MAFDDSNSILRRLFPPETVREILRGERTRYPCVQCARPMWAHWDDKDFRGCAHARHRLEPWD